MKEQVLNTASSVHKCCRGSTNCLLHCINITFFSFTSSSYPLNFLYHYCRLLHYSFSFLSVLFLYSASLILEISLDLPFFRSSLSVSSSLFLKRAYKEDVVCSLYGNVPHGTLSQILTCSTESFCYSQFAHQSPQIARQRKDRMLSNAASSQLHCCHLYCTLLYTLMWNLEQDAYGHTGYRERGQHRERGEKEDKGENIQK